MGPGPSVAWAATPWLRCALIIAVAMIATPLAAQDQPATCDFEDGHGWWKLSGDAAVVEEGGNHFLRLPHPANLAVVPVAVPAGAASVTITMRVRAKGVVPGAESWRDVRIAGQRVDAAGKTIAFGPCPHVAADTDGWVTATDTTDLPAGTTAVQLAPAIFATAGAADFDDIVVSFASGTSAAPPAAAPATDAPRPAGAAAWGSEPVVESSPVRGQIALDGAWRFAPTAAKEPPLHGWGWMSVPSSWRDDHSLLAAGGGSLWTSYDRNAVRGAWYERDITIPAAWAGRAILLDVSRVSTDATVYLDGTRCGAIEWPEGTVDLTAAAVPGTTQRLRVHVVATLDKAEVMVLMGDLPGQTSVAKAELQTGGLTGAVRLLSRPRGPRVADVLVRTSVRRNELAFDLELADVAAAGDLSIEAVITEPTAGGAPATAVKRFTATAAATADASQVVTVAWPWADAKRWDVGQPNLYDATIAVHGAGIADVYVQRFGFRECWIDGRKIMLNGTEWRMRPRLVNPFVPGGWTAELARQTLARGHDFGEFWPNDPWERGTRGFEQAYDVADEVGLPVNGVTPHMGWRGGNLTGADRVAAYRAACVRLMRRARNHPSVVMWGTSGNMTGGSLDPSIVGQREAARAEELKHSNDDAAAARARAEAGLRVHHELDPTRPVFIHNGGPNGDLYTINNYLVAIPLQEREEWLSTWAEKGDMPLMYVEFGTPLSFDYNRGRRGFMLAAQSEPLFSEFAAAEFGVAAYRDETAEYRQVIREKFQKDQSYAWMHGEQRLFRLPSFLAVQERYITNTWRSWRTMGITGGMIPWDDGYYELGGRVTRAGEAMRAANGPTLAWICGAAVDGDRAAFTAKDHSFSAGARVSKRVALLNDSRAPRDWSLTWRATLAGREIGTGRAAGSLATAETTFAPVAFSLPAPLDGDKAEGEITIEAHIGDSVHHDRFAFRAFAPLVPATAEVLVHDPVGLTTALLKRLGYRPLPWTGAVDRERLLVIGRGAFTDAKPMPGDLAAFIRGGGRAIIEAQDPRHVRDLRGMRMSYKASRRVFPVDATHPALAGLDAEDLRDWAGSGTLLEPKPDYAKGDPDAQIAPATGLPAMGWRWGLRGTVATAAPEKPHRAGWRPILECEFDLAYSPLMELDLGAGRVLWCQLDLEDHAALDPAAARLARQVLEYARTAPLAPRVTATYVGGDRGAALLDRVGLAYERAGTLPRRGLAVIGADAHVDGAALDAFARAGGRVLVLPRAGTDPDLGITLVKREDDVGSLTPPTWPECRGLSASDLRARVESSAWLISGGAEVGADGMIGRRLVGHGVVVFCQVDPDRFDADHITYQRFSRWRSTRALAQLLANLGGAFAFDDRVLVARPPAPSPDISLAGPWKAKQTLRLPAAVGNQRHADPGISPATRVLLNSDVDDTGWQELQMPAALETFGGTWADADGESVLRRVVDVPAALASQELILDLGTIDDFDITCVNGVQVGGRSEPNAYAIKRSYPLPAGLIKPGRNVIAVRVWDCFGGAGFTGTRDELVLRPAHEPPPVATMYHPDYRTDWDLGDEPARYYNW